jgi:hypothetical protein
MYDDVITIPKNSLGTIFKDGEFFGSKSAEIDYQ